MKFWFCAFLVVCITKSVIRAENSTCSDGHWGTDCYNLCGACYYDAEVSARTCDSSSGACPFGCLGGYTGRRCDESICEGGCGSGVCLAPNYCGNCGDISKVSPTCEDIRLRGLLGSLISFIVIGLSITFCGLGSVWYKRHQATPVHL